MVPRRVASELLEHTPTIGPTDRGCIGESPGGGIIKGNELFKARGAGGVKKMKSKRGLHTVTFRFLGGRRLTTLHYF